MTKVTDGIKINVPKTKVWDVIADLGSISVWHPIVTDSHYISETKEGLGASRHCDLPSDGYVKERIIDWKPGEAFTLDIYEGTTPFSSAKATISLADDGDGTMITFTIEYDLKSDDSVDPQEVKRQYSEELFPLVLSSLKHYIETGKPMPFPKTTETLS